MPHDPNDPITIRGGSMFIQLPMLGLKSDPSGMPTSMKFNGHTPDDHITKIVVRTGDTIIFQADKTLGVEKWTVEVFFDHP